MIWCFLCKASIYISDMPLLLPRSKKSCKNLGFFYKKSPDPHFERTGLFVEEELRERRYLAYQDKYSGVIGRQVSRYDSLNMLHRRNPLVETVNYSHSG